MPLKVTNVTLEETTKPSNEENTGKLYVCADGHLHYVDENDNDSIVTHAEQIHELGLSMGLKNVRPSPSNIVGVDDEIVTGLTASDATERALGGNHLLM